MSSPLHSPPPIVQGIDHVSSGTASITENNSNSEAQGTGSNNDDGSASSTTNHELGESPQSRAFRGRTARSSSISGISGISGTIMSESQTSSRWNPYNRGTGRWNLWSNIAQHEALWENIDDEESVGNDQYDEVNSKILCQVHKSFFYEIKHVLTAFLSNPFAVLLVIATFGGILILGLHLVNLLAQRVKQQMMYEATCTAMESANIFADLFRKALLPLFSLQQAVTHSEYFQELPTRIGKYGAPGSAAAISGAKSPPNVTDYRNITGICDDPYMQEKFKEIVDSIQKSQEMEDIIITYRLAPHAVFCMAEPMEAPIYPYSKGNFLKNQGAMGWDPLNSGNPKWGHIVRNTLVYNNESVDILGPMDMTKLGSPGAEMYCGHLDVKMPNHKIEIDNTVYKSWGFVMHFLHWTELKKRAGVYKIYEEKGLDFVLTRTDKLFNSTSGEYYDKLITIASSDNSYLLTDENSVTHKVNTANGVWTNRVGYVDGYKPEWCNSATIGVACLAALISIMLGIILVERKLHKELLFKIMPKKAIKKLHRGQTVIERYNLVTIFFSDIVGFTSMAGEMRPVQVMKMLNELYKEFDKLAAKHDVYKVETIGDAYMVVGGCPDRCSGAEAAEKVALFALDIVNFVKNGFRTSEGNSINIRCGLASGPVVAGVVGTSMPRYCLFGDTVNLASRMESTSKTMKIQCSEVTYRLLRDAPGHAFALHERVNEQSGKINSTASQMSTGVMIKGKGIMQTWWIKRAISFECNKGGKYEMTERERPVVKAVKEPPPRAITFNIPNDMDGGSTDGLLLGLDVEKQRIKKEERPQGDEDCTDFSV